jgi:hypothetical protein
MSNGKDMRRQVGVQLVIWTTTKLWMNGRPIQLHFETPRAVYQPIFDALMAETRLLDENKALCEKHKARRGVL